MRLDDLVLTSRVQREKKKEKSVGAGGAEDGSRD